jgi:hypothetical protein
MAMKKAITRLVLIFALGYCASGCFWDLPPSPHGFTIKTTFTSPPSPTQSSVSNPDPNVQVIGNFKGFECLLDHCGSVQSFDITTGSDGKNHNSDWAAPGTWDFTRNGGHAGCGVRTFLNRAISCGQTATLDCSIIPVFAMSPDMIEINAPPATAALLGQGLSTTYGMPTIEFYDEYGSYYQQTTASSVSADGTWLQTNVPSLSGLYSGVYTMVIVNATPDGSRDVVGTASVWVYGNYPPPPDPDPDPCLNPIGNVPPECEPILY